MTAGQTRSGRFGRVDSIVFDAPHNRHFDHPRVYRLCNWRELEGLLAQICKASKSLNPLCKLCSAKWTRQAFSPCYVILCPPEINSPNVDGYTDPEPALPCVGSG